MIRVLRLIEYRYQDAKQMADDMGRWGIGANATRNSGSMSIASSVLLPEHIHGEVVKPSRRERVYRWLRAEEAYADEKFSDANYDLIAGQIRAWVTDADNSEPINFISSYLKRAEMMGLNTPQGRQALAKAASTIIDYLHHAENIHGDLPQPGVPSGEIHEWNLDT